MALSLSARLGLTRWSADTDPLARTQLDADHGKLDELAALDVQYADLAARPAAAIRGRYGWLTATRELFRDSGTLWHKIAETDSSGLPILRRPLANDKAAGDLPSTYPMGLSNHDTAAQGGWPAPNLGIVTHRSASRTIQTITQAITGRVWTRSQNASGTDSWGRFSEMMEQLRFTSTTRPTADLYDGLRAYETDTTGTVVYLASANRWVYEGFLLPPSWDHRGNDGQGLFGNQDWVLNFSAATDDKVDGSPNLEFPNSAVTIQIPGWYDCVLSARIGPANDGTNYERTVFIQQERPSGTRFSRRSQTVYTTGGVTSHAVSGLVRCNAGDRLVAMVFTKVAATTVGALGEGHFSGTWVRPL